MLRRVLLIAGVLALLLGCGGGTAELGHSDQQAPQIENDGVDSSPGTTEVGQPDLDRADRPSNPPDTTEDIGEIDSSTPTADASDSDPGPGPVPTRYLLSDGTHSRITPYVVQRLLQIAEKGSGLNPRVFIKVGDSMTDTPWFLNCFSDGAIDLDGRDELLPTIGHFDFELGGDETPWNRTSLAMKLGKTAAWAIGGNPSPLASEYTQLKPQFAVVGLGGNDIHAYGNDYPKKLIWYRGKMTALLDELIGQGIIPLVTAVAPQSKDLQVNSYIPTMNALLRGLAQERQIPYIDFHAELLQLPKWGLSSDGLHPGVHWVSGGTPGCTFTDVGLKKGFNLRNLVTLQALDRVRRAILGDPIALEPGDDKPLAGTGSHADPFQIDGFPFTHRMNTAGATNTIDQYEGCNAPQDERGGEFVYRLTLTEPTRIRATVLDGDGVDIDLHLLKGMPSGAACHKRGDSFVAGELQPGTWYFVLDTYVSSDGTPNPGAYQFILSRCLSTDSYCN